ncbi:MAG: CRTAC1 family protein [Armatimonadota bacterium]
MARLASFGLRIGLGALLASVTAAGCVASAARTPRLGAGETQPAAVATFRDVAAEAGLDFRLGHEGRTPLSILETAPGGGAFLDWDQDGRLDIVLAGESKCALYRNSGDGRFTDVTRAAGLPTTGHWMGVAVGDYDGDTYPDLLLTGYRTLALLRNVRGTRFQDVTAHAGLNTSLWTTSAAFFDYDRDGDLDLYVGAYLAYHRGKDDLCQVGPITAACGPEHYEAEKGLLYRNEGGGRFRDVTQAFGLAAATGKTWGVAVCDYDRDGWPDLYLANDMVPCDLFRNEKGRFRNIGVESGTALDGSGNVLGGMGADWGDADGDGRPDLFLGTYFQQPNCLFKNQGDHLFREVSDQVGLGLPTRAYVAFGCGFLDLDLDGDLDLFVTNGHVRDSISGFDPSQTYPQPMQLLENLGTGQFRDATRGAGEPFKTGLVGRGCAFGDYDGDGDEDILVVDLEGPVRLLQNQTPVESKNWLTVRLRGKGGNREAIGARVEVYLKGRTLHREVQRSRGVLSSSAPALHFGLGESQEVERVRAHWPDGTRSEVIRPPIREVLSLVQR